MARKSRKNAVIEQPNIFQIAQFIRMAQYIRLSVEDSNNKGNSIENQKLLLDDFIANNPKVMPYFDIPIQHSEDKMLKVMHRRGNREYLLNLFNSI